ncbi:MAG: hypothetical protein CMJ58_15215 [Planctomycetaceae bacterium]|nr:hypothetical protein [Planctomycetaceae bacterium]
MPATVVVGGQYGSEGKGKVTTLRALQESQPWVVRCGGPNSGHSTAVDGEETILRQLPAAAGQEDARLLLSAGCAIDEEVLVDEIHRCRIKKDRLFIDPRAVLVEDADRLEEEALSREIGSTGSGTGAALVRRMRRQSGVRLASASEQLNRLATVRTIAPFLHRALEEGDRVIIEGTQGFGLSLLHGEHYPCVTSRDTTASGFASEAGISPRDIDEVIMVIRTFPIRVAGYSGPLGNELSWYDVHRASGSPRVEEEYTSVTKRVRRVGAFDLAQVRKAAAYNRPTSLAVMGLDRLDHRDRSVSSLKDLSPQSLDFLAMLRVELGLPFSWVGTGFKTMEAISTQGEFVGEAVNAR